jgi:2-polyprenyl-6-methoxyphenol hydroxylase-like FAD-dependent oxidoreductase
MEKMEKPMRVAIIGAGMTGLLIAQGLKKVGRL